MKCVGFSVFGMNGLRTVLVLTKVFIRLKHSPPLTMLDECSLHRFASHSGDLIKPLFIHNLLVFIFLKISFIFRERGREGEGEKH